MFHEDDEALFDLVAVRPMLGTLTTTAQQCAFTWGGVTLMAGSALLCSIAPAALPAASARGAVAGESPTYVFNAGINESASMHPFHVSNAEVEWKDDTKCLEIALKVWPIDLEEALEKQTQRMLDLDKTEDIDTLIVAYLQTRFVFHQADGTPAKIDWLGKEVSVKSAWLYFEIPLEKSPEGLEVENRLFLEQLPDQVNLIQFKTGHKRMTLRFAADQPKQKLDYSLLKYGL